MRIYTVINDEKNYREDFYSLSEAKKAMKENDAEGFITKVWSNGDWEPAGEITLKGTNKTFIANTRQTTKSYN